ncbi:MAG: hypothetical protein EXS43_07550 [Opitutus sp.]|nr:hypothetical protein [Opitutus sp.]
MNLGYGYAVDDAGCEAFHLLPRGQRERLLSFFRQLADHPFTRGDYQDSDARGQPLKVPLFDEQFLVTWHADHAAKQIRIVGLEAV